MGSLLRLVRPDHFLYGPRSRMIRSVRFRTIKAGIVFPRRRRPSALEARIHDCANLLLSRPEKEEYNMFQLLVYPITPRLWRWEIWCGGALFRCGAAPTGFAAAMHVHDVVNA
jgi:hypothetical protein